MLCFSVNNSRHINRTDFMFICLTFLLQSWLVAYLLQSWLVDIYQLKVCFVLIVDRETRQSSSYPGDETSSSSGSSGSDGGGDYFGMIFGGGGINNAPPPSLSAVNMVILTLFTVLILYTNNYDALLLTLSL